MSKTETKPAQQPQKLGETPWQPMSTAPQDGRPVWLKGPGNIGVECFWRQSRKFSEGKWAPFFYWSRVIGPYTMLNFEPKGWFREDKKTA